MKLFFYIVIFAGLYPSISPGKESPWKTETRLFELVSSSGKKLHIELHGSRQHHLLAEKIQYIMKNRAVPILDYFSYVPDEILHIVINPKTRSEDEGGQAMVWPRNTIMISPTPPLNRSYVGDSGHWLELLMVHELIHILHMDQTRGILRFIRHIMGSIGKAGGLVPRWFIEGLAVWGESTFLPHGRLKNPALKDELHILFQKDHCQTIDCLDEPGHYPYGRYPYWIGAFFLDFLEKKKSGNLACIVRENSFSLPFFLGNAFEKCLGKGPEESFDEFRAFIKKRKVAPLPRNHESVPFKKHADWQGGMAMTKKGFFYLGQGKETGLVMKNKKEESFPAFSHQMAVISDPSPYSKQTGILPMAVYDSPFGLSKRWILWDSRSQSSRKMTLPGNPRNLFLLGENDYLILTYKKLTWQVYRLKNGKERLLHTFPPMASVVSPRVFFHKGRYFLIVRVHQIGKEFTLSKLDLSGNLHPVYRSPSLFRLLSVCDNRFIIQKGESLHLISGNESIRIKNKWSGNVFYLDHFQDKSILLTSRHPGKMFVGSGKCDKIFTSGLLSNKPTLPETTPKEKKLDYTMTSYPSFHHFIPGYWGVLYNGGENLGSWRFFTSFGDPLHMHFTQMSLNYYPEANKKAPNISHSMRMGRYKITFNYEKDFFLFSRNNQFGSEDTVSVSLSRSIKWSHWNYIPTISYYRSKIHDFISRRNDHSYALIQSFRRASLLQTDPLKNLYLQGRVFRKNTERESFYGVRSVFNTRLEWGRFSPFFSSSYGKLFKKSLGGGVFYGGGGNRFNASTPNQFYGIDYTDAYGNEILTGRCQLDFRLAHIHRGSGLLPLFFKKIHGVAGFDFIKSPYIFAGNQLLVGESLQSLYGGLRFKFTLGYYLPFDMDLLYTSLMDDMVDEKRLLIAVRGQFFP